MTEFRVGDPVKVLSRDFRGLKGEVQYVGPVVNDILLEDGTELAFANGELELAVDAVNPSHYIFPGGVQVIDITRHLGFLEGNAVKYLCRAGRKGDRLEDLKKAEQYVKWAIEDAERS